MPKAKNKTAAECTGVMAETRKRRLVPGEYFAEQQPERSITFSPNLPDAERAALHALADKLFSNLFSHNDFRVKSVRQIDRAEFWDYEVVLVSHASEIILRHAETKYYDQPSLPKLGDHFLFRLQKQADGSGQNSAGGPLCSEKVVPTLKPYGEI